MAAFTSACVAAADPLAGGGADEEAEPSVDVQRTTIVPTMRPSSADDLGIAVDAAGRPYDNYWGPEGATAEIRSANSLLIDRGRLEIIGGEAFLAGDPITIRDTRSIDFRGVEELDLDIIWKLQADGTDQNDADGHNTDRGDSEDEAEEQLDGEDEQLIETILGVIASVPDGDVVRWGEFTKGYETKDGLGGLTSRSVLEWAGRNLEPETPMVAAAAIEGRPFAIVDVDGDDVRDLFLFDSGTDGQAGEFSLAKGFNDDDIMVAVIIWHGGFPWRLAVPEGEPPPDIADRENELIDCIEGRRLIDKWSRCT